MMQRQIQGRDPGGLPLPDLFLDQTEAQGAEKKFFGDRAPHLSQGLDEKLNGCWRRLLFTQELTQRKCSLCSQRTVIKGPCQKLLWFHVNVAFKSVSQVLGVSSEYIKTTLFFKTN